MNYIGSKYSLLDFLEASIKHVVDESCHVFCDLFAGTGAVGVRFKQLGYQIIANDLQYYSYVLNRHYVGNHKPLLFDGLADVIQAKTLFANPITAVCGYLSNIEGVEGFLYKNYAPTGSAKTGVRRQFFTDENAKKCDAIRQQIERWKENGNITDDEYYFLLTSLIESIDARANTAAVYGAFLKRFKASALKPLQLKPPLLIENDSEHMVYQQDVNKLIRNIRGDILYLDPPYNHRQYSSYYHILETIAKNDEPSIRGLAGIRNDDVKSLYCQKANAEKAFHDVVRNADVRYIFVSYNNEGILPLDAIRTILEERGQYGCFTKRHKRFQADVDANRNIKGSETAEYLHYVRVAK